VHAWRAAYAVTADQALADDAAQEAIQKAFGALDRYDETRPFGPWLKRIAINRAIAGKSDQIGKPCRIWFSYVSR
jgi:DNA-directed RNA polymerase specialized sigma24 family protein